MTRGKYAARADTRLKVLESEALKEASAKIKELERQLGAAHHERDTTRAEMQSKALSAAAGMSAREKRNLRNQIASLEHQVAADRIRNAVLVWEIMHRAKFDEPSPVQILPDTPSYDYWITVHWEIGSLFCPDYDEIWKFFRLVEGYEWRIAGSLLAGDSGQPTIKQNAREASRAMIKGGLKGGLVRRMRDMREYYDRIWAARQSGDVEPILHFQDAHSQDAHHKDRREKLIEKMKSHD